MFTKKTKNLFLILIITLLATCATYVILQQINGFSEEGSSSFLSDIKKGSAVDREYYLTLKNSCKQDKCCLSSVSSMQEHGYKLAENNKCQDKFVINQLLCVSSLKWCQ